MKFIVFAIILFIFASLVSSLMFLVRDPVGSKRTVKALTWRISLSIGLFVLLFIAFAFGWITPHPLMLS